MTDLYEKLARHLDNPPSGFPSNEFLTHFMGNRRVSHKTQPLRGIPVSRQGTAEPATIPYETAKKMIADQKKWLSVTVFAEKSMRRPARDVMIPTLSLKNTCETDLATAQERRHI